MPKAIRTGRIEIDLLKQNDTQWISADIQHLEIDDEGTILVVKMRDGKLYRRVDQVALQTINIKDPVTQQDINMSVAGIGVAIKRLMVNWMIEDNPSAIYDPAKDLVVVD